MVVMAGKPGLNVMKPLFRAFCINYLLALHAILSVGVVWFMKYFVDGKTVNPGAGKRYLDGKTFLRVSDITTMVSAVLVLFRLVTSTWTTLSAWRCAFILLEKDGLTLLQFDRIVSLHIPWPLWLGLSRHYLFSTIVLVLLLPSVAVAPVLSGAVNWRSAHDSQSIPDGSAIGTLDPQCWETYTSFSQSDAVNAVVKPSSLAWLDIGEKQESTCRRLVSEVTTVVPAGSTVDNAVLPCVKFHSLSWDKKLDEGTLRFLSNGSLLESYSGLNFSSEFYPGLPILFDLDEYNYSYLGQPPSYPSLTTFSGAMKIAIAANTIGANCSLAGYVFGDITMSQYNGFSVIWDQQPVCFFVGTVNLTAGIVRNPSSPVIYNNVIMSQEEPDIEPSPWAEVSLLSSPAVMFKLAMLNITSIPTWNNLDGYAKAVIRQSYSGAWEFLNGFYDARPAINLTVHNKTDMLQASVYFPRVWLWYFVQLLLTLSGVLLLWLQSSCLHPVVTNGVAASLVVNSTNVPWIGKGGREDMSEVARQASSGKILHLEKELLPDDDSSSGQSLTMFSLVEHEAVELAERSKLLP